jgi:hypothetical protein
VLLVQIVILFAAKSVGHYVQYVGMSTLGVNFVKKKRQVDLHDKIAIQDLEFFHRKQSGNLYTIVSEY